MVTALVIDDNRETADSLCQLLSLLEIVAQPAYGPRAALEYLLQTVPDLVLLDLNMPGVNGLEVLRYLRREPPLMDVPVIVVTAEDERFVLQRALRDGATAVIIKPAMIEELEAVLRKIQVIS
jgi:two-component system chemotaxis response regulator CheY